MSLGTKVISSAQCTAGKAHVDFRREMTSNAVFFYFLYTKELLVLVVRLT